MTDLVEALGKLLGLLLAFFGITKWVNHALEKRVTALEASPPKREVAECQRLQNSCSVAVRLGAVEKQSDGLTDWLKRIEAKLDRLIEKGD
ncbi:MAG TPA: hypothetical protein DCZ95_18160 [Verrucomicrobia bacterium]|nr:hypothetical protein [Verrucomicrobiota bacterium]